MYRRRSFVRSLYIYIQVLVYITTTTSRHRQSPQHRRRRRQPMNGAHAHHAAAAATARDRSRERPILCLRAKYRSKTHIQSTTSPMHHAHASRPRKYSDIRKLHTSIHIPHVKYYDVNEEGDLCWRYLSSSYMNSKKSHSSHKVAKRNYSIYRVHAIRLRHRPSEGTRGHPRKQGASVARVVVSSSSSSVLSTSSSCARPFTARRRRATLRWIRPRR